MFPSGTVEQHVKSISWEQRSKRIAEATEYVESESKGILHYGSGNMKRLCHEYWISSGCDLLQLPIDILFLILQYAYDPKKYIQMASTCKLFFRLMFDEVFPSHVYIDAANLHQIINLPIKHLELEYLSRECKRWIHKLRCENIILVDPIEPVHEEYLSFMNCKRITVKVEHEVYIRNIKQHHRYREIAVTASKNLLSESFPDIQPKPSRFFYKKYEVVIPKEQLMNYKFYID